MYKASLDTKHWQIPWSWSRIRGGYRRSFPCARSFSRRRSGRFPGTAIATALPCARAIFRAGCEAAHCTHSCLNRACMLLRREYHSSVTAVSCRACEEFGVRSSCKWLVSLGRSDVTFSCMCCSARVCRSIGWSNRFVVRREGVRLSFCAGRGIRSVLVSGSWVVVSDAVWSNAIGWVFFFGSDWSLSGRKNGRFHDAPVFFGSRKWLSTGHLEGESGSFLKRGCLCTYSPSSSVLDIV